MYGDADEVCPMDQVEWLMDEIGHLVYGNYQFGGYDHADFGKAQGDVFMQQINDALYHLDPSQGLTYELTYADEAEYAFETAHEMQQRTQEYDEEPHIRVKRLDPLTITTIALTAGSTLAGISAQGVSQALGKS